MPSNAIGMIETKGYVAALAAADAMVKAAKRDSGGGRSHRPSQLKNSYCRTGGSFVWSPMFGHFG